MSKPSRTEPLPDNLLEHRAVKAWAALKTVRVEPDGIEILKTTAQIFSKATVKLARWRRATEYDV